MQFFIQLSAASWVTTPRISPKRQKALAAQTCKGYKIDSEQKKKKSLQKHWYPKLKNPLTIQQVQISQTMLPCKAFFSLKYILIYVLSLVINQPDLKYNPQVGQKQDSKQSSTQEEQQE